MRNSLIGLAILGSLVGGCALSPTTGQVAEFGKAANAVIEDFKGAETLHVDLVEATRTERQAYAYLTGKRYALPTTPPHPTASAYAAKLQFIDALSAYFTALSEATDPAAVTRLEAAADGYATAMSTFAGKIGAITGTPSPLTLPVIGPALQLVAYTGVNLYELELRRRIRAIIEQAEPAVIQGTGLLIADIEEEKRTLQRDYRDWLAAKRSVLEAVRGNRAGAYATFLAADEQARAYAARLVILDDAGKDLGELILAHRAMAADDPSATEAALAKLQTIATRAASVLKALK